MQVEQKEIDGKKIPWVADDDYTHLIGKLRLQLTGVFEPFNKYGLDVFIPGAKDAIIKLCEDFALCTRGLDHAIDLAHVKTQTTFRDG